MTTGETTPQTASFAGLGNISSISTDVIATALGRSNGINGKALLLNSKETAIDVGDSQDDADFANLGIDRLMPLMLAEI